MFNFVGKGLILFHTLLSLAGMTLAIIIFFQYVDWGRADPRLAGADSKGPRVPAEIDKTVVAVREGEAARNMAVPLMAPAEKSLQDVAARFPENHLFYVAELKRLSEADGDIKVQAITADGVPTDTPGLPYGKPIPSVDVPGVTKSLKSLQNELKTYAGTKDKKGLLQKLELEIQDFAAKDEHTSFLLTGEDKDGKKQHGLYRLIDEEFKFQQKLKSERDYLQPFWAGALEEARRFATRRVGLEKTLEGLEKAMKERGLK